MRFVSADVTPSALRLAAVARSVGHSGLASTASTRVRSKRRIGAALLKRGLGRSRVMRAQVVTDEGVGPAALLQRRDTDISVPGTNCVIDRHPEPPFISPESTA